MTAEGERLAPLAEVLASENYNTVKAQIRVRLKLLDEMVGWLYPSILRAEIAKLNECLDHIEWRLR